MTPLAVAEQATGWPRPLRPPTAQAAVIRINSKPYPCSWNRECLRPRVVQAATDFALPSQTFYFEHGVPLDKTRSEEARAEVRRLREEGLLYQYKLPDKTIQKLTETLQYPEPPPSVLP